MRPRRGRVLPGGRLTRGRAGGERLTRGGRVLPGGPTVGARPVKARLGGGLLAAGLLAAGTAGCDDQLKYVPWFSAMTDHPSVQTYQEEPRPPVEGTVPVDGARAYGLLEADTALSSPLRATAWNVAWGRELYGQFCTPCHGPSGRGDGPVMMSERRPRGIPFTPAMDILSETARGRSDGYIWGMITEGRGLMPSYRRIPRDDRWHLVLYVRHLQAGGGATAATAEAASGGGMAGGADPAGTAGAAARSAAGEGR